MANVKIKLMHELDEKVVAIATGLFGAVVVATGVLFHGIGQPYMMNMMYGYWGGGVGYLVFILGGLVLGAFYGWLFAVIYNWVLRNMK